jgi:hypothetical protein
MTILFIFLSAIVIAFLLMLTLMLIKIEKTIVMALMTTEEKILKVYGKK